MHMCSIGLGKTTTTTTIHLQSEQTKDVKSDDYLHEMQLQLYEDSVIRLRFFLQTPYRLRGKYGDSRTEVCSCFVHLCNKVSNQELLMHTPYYWPI